jgi:hypothetical protein
VLLKLWLDLYIGRCLYHHVSAPSIQNPLLAAVQSLDVCRYGYISRHPCFGRCDDVRTAIYGEADWPVMGGFARRFVHPGRCAICRKCHSKPWISVFLTCLGSHP